jgi:hypothetical protein
MLYSHMYPQCEPVYVSGSNVYTCNNAAIATLSASCEYTAAQKASIKSTVLAEYASLGITSDDILDDASTLYNCHAYAWHLTEGHTNQIWINQTHNGSANLSKYWSGSSACFIECTEINAEKIFYYSGDHSAVKSTVAGKYESKWGRLPLIRHAPTSVPTSYQGAYRRYYKKNIAITGPVLIPCSETVTYSIPSGISASPTWTVSQNLQIVSGQGTNTITVSKHPSSLSTTYLGTITVSDSGSGSEIASMDVNIGPVSLQSITAPTTINVGVPFYCTPSPYNANSTYEWAINPVPYTNITDGGSGICLVTITQSGAYTIICREVTACSKSVYVTRSVQVMNTATSYTVGTGEDNRFVVSLTEEAKNAMAVSAGQTVTYALYSLLSGTKVETGQLPYTGGDLNFSKYPAGLYVLQIDQKDGAVETHRIVLK